ncbi:methyltransferase domain-containing protein [Paenibacillus pasadenensis]|uniref:class I SAM-dependent methyltransferase n=1 Tax=Paenibacillus pasadenensis TaxID=217090 RepID=UPI000416CD89|nr:class I SAM-dependent methyltransferase [Paenibacillus pasadenensis]
MSTSKEQDFLLKSVRIWFNRPEQISHYTHEFIEGPTVAEQYLLNSLPDGSSVLDVGCGTGRISVYLAERGYRVKGIDVSEGLLSVAREISKKRNLDIDFLNLEGIKLPYQDEEFDTLIGFKILCYIPTRELRNENLKEFYRVLKQGGTCIITQNIVPDEYIDDAKDEHYLSSPASEFGILERGDNFPSGNGYVRWFTESDLFNEIKNTDFKIELFESDEEHEGAGYIKLIKLRKPCK